MFGTKVKVSIIIPVYNAEKYLRQALESVAAQTLRAVEVICVDDGSSDGSLAILDEFCRQDRRFRIVRQENAGPGAARNRGMAEARGEYILFLDADDWFEPGIAELPYRRAEETKADIVLFGGRKYSEATGKVIAAPQYLREDLYGALPVFSRRDIPDAILQATTPEVWHRLFSADFLRRTGLQFPAGVIMEDATFTMEAMAVADRIAWIPDVLVTYRVGRTDSLVSRRNDAPLEIVAAYQELHRRLEARGLLEEIGASYAFAAVSSYANNLRLIRDMEARYRLAARLTEPDVLETGILAYPKEQYPDPAKYARVRGCRYAAGFRQYLEGAAGEAPKTVEAPTPGILAVYGEFAAFLKKAGLWQAAPGAEAAHAVREALEAARTAYDGLPAEEQYFRYGLRDDAAELFELFVAEQVQLARRERKARAKKK